MKKQVKFSSLQRFDLGDAVDLQGLVDDQLTLQNFGLKGGTKTSTLTGGMILSPFSCSSVGPANGGLNDANAYITLSQFSFMLPNGEVVQHTDAAETISYITLKNAAISANAARIGYLWGNYNLVNTNQESRKFYSTLDEAEYNQTVFTRTEKQPTFVITTTSGQPGAINGRLWTRLATVTVALSGGFYKVASVNDVKQYNEMAGMQYYKPLEVTSTTSSTRFGLGPYWNNIEEMFYKLITNGSADDSNKTALGYGANPQYSLQGLKYEVDQKTGIDVVASAKLTFQAVSSNWSAFSTWIAANVDPLDDEDLHDILLNKGRRDAGYQHFFNPGVNDEDKPGINLSFYKFNHVLVSTDNCNFIDENGSTIAVVSDLPIYTTQLVGGVNIKGSQSLIRLGISSAINSVSADLINSIYNTNQIKITVTPSWRKSNVYEIDTPSYSVNGCNSLVQVVKQVDTTLTTDNQEKNYYEKIYQKPTTTSLYVDLNCLMCSPWMFQYLNEILWRNMSDPNRIEIIPPDFITVHIDIMGDKRYL
jgi:hypothetical protein